MGLDQYAHLRNRKIDWKKYYSDDEKESQTEQKDVFVWRKHASLQTFMNKMFEKQNEVTYSHIDTGRDFFEYEPFEWDVMVSNPPFTNKRKYFERALSFNKPFALIMTNTWLNDSAPKQLFMDKDLQLLMFDKRMKFISPDGRNNDKITFSSSYYCWNMLPKQIVMETLVVPAKKVVQKTTSKAVLPL